MKRFAILCAGTALIRAFSASADLQPIGDDVLSDMTGQSAIRIDEIPIDLNNTTGIRADGSDRDQGFTRITIGADIELNANIDRTVIGKRPRPDSEVEIPELEADVILNNVSLGTITRADDGSIQMNNFKVRDPYIEIARNADNQLTGVRLGFKEASGTIGHEIVSLSGDITAKAYVDEIVGLNLSGLNLIEYPYNHNTRTNRISTELQALQSILGWSPTLTLHLGELGHTTLNGTQNLYLGFQSEEINYPKVGAGPQGTAHSGFWLNLQDNYDAPNLEISLATGTGGGLFGIDLVSRNERVNNSFSPYF